VYACHPISISNNVESKLGLTMTRGFNTLVHFSAEREPCLSQENTLHTLNTP